MAASAAARALQAAASQLSRPHAHTWSTALQLSMADATLVVAARYLTWLREQQPDDDAPDDAPADESYGALSARQRNQLRVKDAALDLAADAVTELDQVRAQRDVALAQVRDLHAEREALRARADRRCQSRGHGDRPAVAVGTAAYSNAFGDLLDDVAFCAGCARDATAAGRFTEPPPDGGWVSFAKPGAGTVSDELLTPDASIVHDTTPPGRREQ